MKHKLGLVLSGGGVRGAAHIGVLQVMEENGIRPTAISGASIGAIVGALYAAEYSPSAILDFLKSTPVFNWANYSWRKPGFIDTDRFVSLFQEMLPQDNFDSLPRSLFLSVTDLIEAKNTFFSSGPIIKPMLASAAFPVVFSPVSLANSLYSDGGIINNFPVEPLESICEKIIGIHVNQIRKIEPSDLNTSYKVFQRAFEISTTHAAVDKFDRCDLVINPTHLENVGNFDLSQLDQIYQIGYEAGKEHLEQLRELVNPD